MSPVTPDFVNPEAPWPHLQELAEETAREGKVLVERLAVYPSHLKDLDRWIDKEIQPLVQSELDGEGFVRRENWSAGAVVEPPSGEINRVANIPSRAAPSDLHLFWIVPLEESAYPNRISCDSSRLEVMS